MPKHNGGFFEKFRSESGTWWLLWSDYEDYRQNSPAELCVPAKTGDNNEGCDLVDALQYGELDG